MRKDVIRDSIATHCSTACCPFDFLSDFDSWFEYHKCRWFDNLSHEKAEQNVRMTKAGWKLVDGCKYGGWRKNIQKADHVRRGVGVR